MSLARASSAPHDERIASSGITTMATFLCSSCNRSISASGLIEREPMCRACRKARTASTRRPPIAAVVFAPLCAAAITAACLLRGFHSPFDGSNGVANFAFWLVGGMAVGLVVRIAVKSA
jgi:hypothetical protein